MECSASGCYQKADYVYYIPEGQNIDVGNYVGPEVLESILEGQLCWSTVRWGVDSPPGYRGYQPLPVCDAHSNESLSTLYSARYG